MTIPISGSLTGKQTGLNQPLSKANRESRLRTPMNTFKMQISLFSLIIKAQPAWVVSTQFHTTV